MMELQYLDYGVIQVNGICKLSISNFCQPDILKSERLGGNTLGSRLLIALRVREEAATCF